MYPIKINLLSPEKKSYLNRIIYIQFIKNTFISIVFVFCISGIALLGGQVILQEYFGDVSSNLLVSSGLNADTNRQIQEVNTIIKKTEALQAVHYLWLQKIVEIGNAVPDKVVFSSINLNKEKKYINISGTADDRDSLLELKNNINSLDFIQNIEIPLSQLTEKENIKFSIDIEMK